MSGAKAAPETFLDIRGLKKYFSVHGGLLHAVDDVSLSIARGCTLGLVGESGCGKSTLGRVVIGLIEATDGEVLFDGQDSLKFTGAKRSEFRRRAQIVFQDPFSSLNPRMSVSQLIAEPLVINRACPHRELDARVKKLMDTVGLASRLITSFPHELDGGRRQRIGIARALALDPDFIVLDEPVSALDVCIQAQVLNLLEELKKERGYTYLFISHNLSVVRYVSDEVAVMYLGQVVEKADNTTLFKNPVHPYTQALLSAVPTARLSGRRQRIILEGDVPSPINPPGSCRFMGRCAYRQDECLEGTPPLTEYEPGHFVACRFAGRLTRSRSS
ncbi:Oligopeptide transport ATP-binding protein OppF [Fretibacterium fastidiosum]|uniref:ABC transporter ATP-binding protein n=1 Tax=Fretibacterium fastidiosum TaxID=651822 RepID=UPI0038FC431E